MSRTEREIIKSLRQLGNSIKQDPVKEKESYNMLLKSFKEMFPPKTKLNYNFYLSLRPVAVSLLAFVFVFITGFGTIAVAKNAVPGDLLYPVKRIVEKSRMVLAVNQSKKAVLHAEILANRLSEVRTLTEKIKEGDKKSEVELNVLAQNFTNDLKVLTKQIGDQVNPVQDLITPFPDEDLLYIDDELLLVDNGSLPIEDELQIFTVMPSEELEKLLSETKELLAEENLALAFVKLQEAEKLIKEQEPVDEPEVVKEEGEEGEELEGMENQVEKGQEILPIDPIVPEEPKQVIDSIKDNLSGSVGQTLLLKKQIKKIDVYGGMNRVEDATIGGWTRDSE